MSLYRRVSVRIWGDERFIALSAPKPNAQTLFFYLMTGPHTGPIPGLFVAGEGQLAEGLGWSRTQMRHRFFEISSKNMAVADWTARLVYLPNAKNHNKPGNPNIVRGWRDAFTDLPECELKRAAFHDFKAFLKAFSKAFHDAFEPDLVEPNPLPKPFAKPLPKPLANSSGSGSGSGSGRTTTSQNCAVHNVDKSETELPEPEDGAVRIMANAMGITLDEARRRRAAAIARQATQQA